MRQQLSPRQKQLLYYLAEEQIKNYSPISSAQIKEKYKLDFSPATIRHELFELCQMEYLEQPYTSAGRILSDWGWQVLIQDFLDNVFPDNLSISFNDIKDLTKYISKKTKSFSLAYNWKNNDIYTTGLEYIFNDKIINNTIHLYSIAKSIDNIDNTILGIQNILHDRQINVFIGKNNPLIHTKTFSFIATKSNNTNLIVGIITPKVTRYEQHFKIFKSLINSLN